MKRARTSYSQASTQPASSQRSYRSRAVVRRPRPQRYLAFKGKNLRHTGFPDQLEVRHKYAAAYTLSSASGIFVSNLFSANGMFDPFITGTGTQPLYFDQLSAIYDHYTVTASKCTITAVGAGSTSGPGVYVAILQDDDTNTNYTNITDAIQDDVTSWGLTGGVNNAPLKLVKYFNASKAYGIKDVPGDSTMSGTGSSNPSEQHYFRICAQELAFTNTVLVNYTIEIEYTAMWRERKDVPTS